MNKQIKMATTAADIICCSKALLEFRPMLKEEELVEQSLRMMEDGFRLIYISDESKKQASAILGFRIYEMYRTGRMIYIDDLFTLAEYRGKGLAGTLLDHVHFLAAKEGIKSVHLDSGYPLHPAHRLYLNKGYVLPCHHFAKSIEPEQNNLNK
ncbi:GNAT family N-acetyltransferase [Mucilaginibacter sp. OK098]|uniref:GNAT family N-acetyltransferase n=1 Tax=Mucilaginibacter sp. OK098 TaxID=1855297 RepID=UPI000915C731|nr:GNAT family N-acetyltransferase [Mucilaginibacter sp. OK098]SHM94059.1 Acetyltransferase (GNAT) family protein [Mucilaginibacter sp. OK098]